MFHLHINVNYWSRKNGSAKKRYTANVMGNWFILYRTRVRLYLLFEPSQNF